MGNQIPGQQGQVVNTIIDQNLNRNQTGISSSSPQMHSPPPNSFVRQPPTQISQSVPHQNFPPQFPPQNNPPLQGMAPSKKVYQSSPQLQKRSSSMNRVVMTDGEKRINMLSSRVSEFSNELNQSRSILRQKQKLIGSYERDIHNGKGILQDYKNKLQICQKRMVELMNNEKQRQNRIRQLEIQNNQNKNKINYLQSTVVRFEHDKDIMFKQIQDKNSKVGKVQEELFTYINKNRQLEEELKVKNLSKQDTQRQIQIKQKQLDQAFMRNSQIYEEIQKLKQIIQKGDVNARQLQEQLSYKNTQLNQLHELYDLGKHELLSQSKRLSNALIQFQQAKNVGQNQINILAHKLHQCEAQINALKEEKQLIKQVTNERNRLFERKVIYDLKEQNDKLWKKFIQMSQNEATSHQNKSTSNLHGTKTAKTLPTQNQIEQEEYVRRYQKFINNLQNSHLKTSLSISHHSISQNSLRTDLQFYKTKCKQLQDMVQSNININKQLRNQLEKHETSSSATLSLQIQYLKKEIQEQKKVNAKMSSRLSTLMNSEKQYENRVSILQGKTYELTEHNRRLLYEFDRDHEQIKNNLIVIENKLQQLELVHNFSQVKQSRELAQQTIQLCK